MSRLDRVCLDSFVKRLGAAIRIAACGLLVFSVVGCGDQTRASKGEPKNEKEGAATASDASQHRPHETLEQENARLKKALEEARTKKPEIGTDGKAKVTLNDIEYKFISINRNGNLATMKIAVTPKKGNPRLLWQQRIRLIGTNSEEYLTPMGTSGGKGDQSGIRLFEGIRREVVFDLGELPSSMNEISTITIPGANSGGGPYKARKNPVIFRGNFKVE